MVELFSPSQRPKPTRQMHTAAVPPPPLSTLDEFSPTGDCVTKFSNPRKRGATWRGLPACLSAVLTYASGDRVCAHDLPR